MRLEITLVAGASAEDTGFSAQELSILWPPGAAGAGCSGVSLEQALELQWPGCVFTVAGQPLDTLTPGTAPLCDGAGVVAWPAGTVPVGVETHDAAESSGAGALALLVVCSGPAAGTVFALQRGTYSLGRGKCRLHLPDPALSRHHGTLVVGSARITLTAAHGSSGFLLHRLADGPTASAQAINGTVTLETGHRVSCGNSLVELRLPPQHPTDASLLSSSVSEGIAGSSSCAAASGVSTRGSSATATTAAADLLNLSATETIAVPHLSGSSRASLAMLLTGLLPLLLGTALAVFTGSPMFLAFAAMGAVTVLVPLLGGGRRRKAFRVEVSRAVDRDTERAERTFPDAATLVLELASIQPTTPVAGPDSSSPLELALRVGVASRAAQIAPEPHDPGFTAPRLHAQPFTVPLGVQPTTVGGPGGPVLALLNFVLMQLDAAAIPVVLWGPPESLPWAARFLPHTRVTISAAAAQQALASTSRPVGDSSYVAPCVLLMVGNVDSAGMALGSYIRTLRFNVDDPDTGPAASSERNLIMLRADGPGLAASWAGQDFIPDGVPPKVFAAHARRRAWMAATQRQEADGSLAANYLPLSEECNAASLTTAWARSAGGPLLPVPIGRSLAGLTLFNFQQDGPHLLVGGTTGSGKSEFLRTLVGSLAAAHSPSDLQFVFVDFKGGAGLGTLGKLPHTSSMVTDLGGHGLDRTLASLRAELRRREAALSTVDAADSAAYRTRTHLLGNGTSGYGMAHLVIVIDEFRVLVDQFPEAMAELMRIAAVGRSLGIHLVMATQRPQGAVNADIRANVTSSICLRVQSGFDSVDVIGSTVAADIAVATPGRAYISRAGGGAEEFQSAVLGLPPSGAGLVPRVKRADEAELDSGASGSWAGAAGTATASGVDGVAEMMTQAWRHACADDSALVSAPAVVAPELPSEVSLADDGKFMLNDLSEHLSVAGAASGPGTVLLGLMDLPEQQRLKPLVWLPLQHSHVACFGTASETSRAVALVVDRVLYSAADLPEPTDAPESDSSTVPLLYLLDADGSLQEFATNSWVGSYLTPQHLRAAAHLVKRLRDSAGTSTHPLLLCITDWGRWASAFRSSPWHEAEDVIAELVRFGGKNLIVVVGGARELLTAGFMAAIPNRMYLSNGSPAESTMLWPRIPQFAPLPGRAAVDGPINSVNADPLTNSMHVAQLGVTAPAVSASGKHRQLRAHSFAGQALRVSPLPESVSPKQLIKLAELSSLAALPQTSSGNGAGMSLMMGIGGDGDDPVSVRLEPGTALPVLGGPQTGKSSFLRMLAHLATATWLSDVSVDTSFDTTSKVLLADNPLTLAAEHLQIANQYLAAGGVLVIALPYPGPAMSRLPLEWGLRTAQQGVVLRPQRATDGELFGVRLDTAGSEPPGRAVLIDALRREWFQFPFIGGPPTVSSG